MWLSGATKGKPGSGKEASMKVRNHCLTVTLTVSTIALLPFSAQPQGFATTSAKALTATVSAPALAQPGSGAEPDSARQAFLTNWQATRTHLPGPALPATPGANVSTSIPETVPSSTFLTAGTSSLLLPPPPLAAPTDPEIWVDTWFPWSATGGGSLRSQVGEPSVANSGKAIFQSGNWYGSYSTNDGSTFASYSPFTNFPSGDYGGFCCDQDVLYDPGRDIFLWNMLYLPNSTTGDLRLAIFRGTTFANNGVPSGVYYYDLPTNVISPGDCWDYPHLSLGTNSLYITGNLFNIVSGAFTKSFILRIPLDPLAAGAGFSYNYYTDTTHGSFLAAQGIGKTVTFAAHNSTSSIRLATWAEGSGTIFFDDHAVTAWTDAVRKCPGPDGRDWCGRADNRITGMAVGTRGDESNQSGAQDGYITIMWSASQGGSFPYPYQDVARFKVSDHSLVDQPILWNSGAAWIYGALGANARGDLGVSIFFGGGTSYNAHVIGFIDDVSAAPGAYYTTGTSNAGPTSNVSGDYLTCRPHYPDGNTWVASGFVQWDGDSTPIYALFGRLRDAGGLMRWWAR